MEKMAKEVQAEEKYDNKKIKLKRNLINKKSIIILIIVFLVAIFLMLTYVSIELSKKGHIYADIAIPAIITSWDSQELISRANPEFLKENSEEKIESTFKRYSDKLGQLKEYKSSVGKINMHLDMLCQQGMLCQRTTAIYIAKAIFEKEPATIKMEINLRNNKWEIFYFSVTPDTILQH